MKIISFYKDEKKMIRKAIASDRGAQEWLYNKYASTMLSVCRQYVRDLQFAEDVMIKAFFKVFKNLRAYRAEGSFEGWIRKIMIRECIDHLRKRSLVVFDEEKFTCTDGININFETDLDVEVIQKLIDNLPVGYRTVFVLCAVEGYKHEEVSQLLQISENTSKTQLFKARRILQDQLTILYASEQSKTS